MRAQTLLFTSLLRALFVCIFLLLVLLDVSRSLWIDLAGLTITGALLLAVIVLALRRRSPLPAGRGAGGEDSTSSPTPLRPPR